ncbi:MAG TPA: MBL fold metallo-hydrolase, partial [Deltaproteobacteria bacterium]|nr:MBL fold metallo-hydrolase [Deltaproteobacteria bacterium]
MGTEIMEDVGLRSPGGEIAGLVPGDGDRLVRLLACGGCGCLKFWFSLSQALKHFATLSAWAPGTAGDSAPPCLWHGTCFCSEHQVTPTDTPEGVMKVHALFDPNTWTLTYVVYDPDTRDAVVIDPVLDYDPLAVKVSTESAEAVIAFVRRHDLKVHHILETHAHADHLTGAQALKDELGAQTVIGEHIQQVQAAFAKIFDWDASFASDGSQWDLLAHDGEPIRAGSLTVLPI